MKGKFIVIYGANNFGKTLQARILVDELRAAGITAAYLKYPIYELEPTGPRLEGILRKGDEKNLSPLERQKIFAQNRRDYEPTLFGRLELGEWVVAEDYRKTGIAWGITYGVDIWTMEKLNNGMYPEDLEICLDGARFAQAIEENHLHEQSGLWDKNRAVYKVLALRYDWKVVDASKEVGQVARNIWNIVEKEFIKSSKERYN
ncbi:hypothetical protein A2210_01245 [Candidatus Woesebacteria bacterium RIFOXYA1_FULL_40_18]|uniref:Thymidylate kinase-like domain-containing protein n=4 Tax=Candidatus Woeseibacteriota TaxID=1752722 RepID=A0A1F8CML6_9BACT|nr:MAG: hypothetical protein UT72_C0012G0007 [Candidatus Woesebacteria bacterium GW2011_GWB1_40_101]OGM77089.1 MAG: hypothetical protein A2210_01245 [Candidatus Woesebacteria bacterium RIFOXYA1_FULL_40_18]OGM80807.1 MAG: hypothetical protein A2361_00640 [Candidatus Woesebacteria bacterium RIFOXYB1_FULL_40_26]OGM87672.1 MAG: hypothetical protein A2614_01380 [Candidatus Woesebacteria bacterium RIFOXYD1_FULL_40_21]